jgi:hypothetical protein
MWLQIYQVIEEEEAASLYYLSDPKIDNLIQSKEIKM